MPNLLIIVPVIDRPHRIDPLMESINATCDARVIFAATSGYPTESRALRDRGLEVRSFAPNRFGDYAHKINTIINETSEPLIFLGADDVCFHPGWFEAATTRLASGIGVVGTNDLGNPRVIAGEHATHCLITREYAEQGLIDGTPGVLCEQYEHEYVDDEFVGTAKHRNAWVFAHDSTVEHLHPMWGKATTDHLYDRYHQRMITGQRVWERRRHLWT